MSLIGSVGGLTSNLLNQLPGVTQQADGLSATKLAPQPPTGAIADPNATQPGGFGQLFENLVNSVDAKQNEANAISQQVLVGQNNQLHQSVIAMQEASVSLSLMVEVRNKLVDSYQELMRMQV